VKRIRLAGRLAEPISHYADGVEAGGFSCISGMPPTSCESGSTSRIWPTALINTVRRRYFGEARPASTLVEMRALAEPGALVEIDAVAFVARRNGGA